MKGVVEKVFEGHGFIRGDNTVGYFFLPNGVQRLSPVAFDDSVPGDRVDFVEIQHPRGPRAIEVHITHAAEETRPRTRAVRTFPGR